MKKIMNVAHDTKEVKSVLKRGKSPLVLCVCLLMAYLFPLSVFAQEHSTEYFWGEVTLLVGEQKTIYIGDEFGYALDAPVYSNFWNSSNESCVRVVGSNQTKGYCVIEGVSATSSTKVTCQLSYKLSKDSYQWSVWHGYYTVKVTEPPKPTYISINGSSTIFLGKKSTFSVGYLPINAKANFTWSVDNPSIVSISKNDGKSIEVQGIRIGETDIHVETDNGLKESKHVKVMEEKYLYQKTVEDIDLTFFVTSEEDKTCEVYCGYWNEEDHKSHSMTYHYDAPPIVTIPSEVNGYTVTKIGSSAFYGSATLESIKIPNTIVEIGDYALHDCGLTSISIPNSVRSIGDDAFGDIDKFNNLVTVEIPEGVESIGDYAFSRMKELKSITLPNSIKYLGTSVVYGMKFESVISHIEYPAQVKLYSTPNSHTFDFYEKSDKGVTLYVPYGTKRRYEIIPEWANYFDCIIEMEPNYHDGDYFKANVNGVEMSFQIISVSDKTCRVQAENDECVIDQATSNAIEIPSQVNGFTVTSIGDGAFYGCSLPSVTIPNSVTSIGQRAFGFCTNLTSIIIPNSVSSIGMGAFVQCKGLVSAKLSNRLESIGESVFLNCTNLSSVDIPYGVTYIGTDMFDHCIKLTSITIPSSVTSIEGAAFHQCEGLTTIDIPSSVTSIGDIAFEYCSSLTSVTIPNSVKNIGYRAFYGCEALSSVYSLIEKPFDIESNVFNGIPDSAILYVPNGTKAKYEQSAGWSDHFAKIDDGTSDYKDGDVNMDGSVNGTDLVALANIILGKQIETESADVNRDGSVNGTDIVALSNIILGRNNAKRKIAANATTSLSIEPFTINVGDEAEMLIDLDNPDDAFTLVQFDLHLPQGLAIKKLGGDLDIDMADRTTWRKHTLDANTMGDYTRFLLYSSSNTLIEGNCGAIIKVKLVADNTYKGGKIVIDNALLVTPEQKEVKPSTYTYNLDGGNEPNPNNNTPLTIEKFDIAAGGESEMLIDLDNPDDAFTLVQFDLHLPQGLAIKKVGGDLDIDMAERTTWRKHTLDANTMGEYTRFLLYSSSNTLIEGNSGAIIKVKLVADNTYHSGDIVIDNALLVTPDQKEVKPSAYVYSITGIKGVMMTNEKLSTIYNVSGQRLMKPFKGLNIINGKKVVVK